MNTDIDALVSWQMAKTSSGYDHNVNQERCPLCLGDWHGLAATDEFLYSCERARQPGCPGGRASRQQADEYLIEQKLRADVALRRLIEAHTERKPLPCATCGHDNFYHSCQRACTFVMAAGRPRWMWSRRPRVRHALTRCRCPRYLFEEEG